jgi:hypothetical protein
VEAPPELTPKADSESAPVAPPEGPPQGLEADPGPLEQTLGLPLESAPGPPLGLEPAPGPLESAPGPPLGLEPAPGPLESAPEPPPDPGVALELTLGLEVKVGPELSLIPLLVSPLRATADPGMSHLLPSGSPLINSCMKLSMAA